MQSWTASWQFWAAGSAVFAALTAIFGKVGVEGINPDYATFIRTIVILGVTALLLTGTHAWQPPGTISLRTYVFLVLSGIATGASWLCYYRALQMGPASLVAPIDKMSVVLVAIFGVTLLGEKLTALHTIGVLLITGGAVLVAL